MDVTEHRGLPGREIFEDFPQHLTQSWYAVNPCKIKKHLFSSFDLAKNPTQVCLKCGNCRWHQIKWNEVSLNIWPFSAQRLQVHSWYLFWRVEIQHLHTDGNSGFKNLTLSVKALPEDSLTRVLCTLPASNRILKEIEKYWVFFLRLCGHAN